MKKKIIALILLTILMVVMLSACTTSTTGGTPLDGKWKHVEFWNTGELIFEANEVTIIVTESRRNSWSSSSDTWIEYKVTGRYIYNEIETLGTVIIIDCGTLSIVLY